MYDQSLVGVQPLGCSRVASTHTRGRRSTTFGLRERYPASRSAHLFARLQVTPRRLSAGHGWVAQG